MKHITNFIYELGQLKRIKHEGWRLIGVENPESVADHTTRAAQIAFILANLENYKNPYEVCTLVVFHDIGETRVGDIHKVANSYIKVEEEKAVEDQTSKLNEIGKEILKIWKESENRNTLAGEIARDADLLEQAFTAKELIEIGHEKAQDWINNVTKALKTESAKRLLKELQEINSTDWFDGLKKL
ncbi:HD domain-containing protein [Candidatus Woesearchaeota archaeon]|nr:HD domain-containing protein [Candidatus Woesearchaeota archaeon]